MLSLTMLAAGLLPTEASACHHYSRWYYPQAQRCGAARQMVRLTHSGPNWAKSGQSGPGPEIALPSLARADLDGGEADEPTRAKVLLRAALEAPNAH